MILVKQLLQLIQTIQLTNNTTYIQYNL